MKQLHIYDSSDKKSPVISQLIEIYQNRDLLKLLVIRDLTVRYKRSVLGVWWSLLNPMFTTAVLYYVMNTVFKSKLPNGDSFLPYILSGVLLMALFNQAINLGAESIATGSGIFNKIYVRPEIFALSATISSSINFMIGLIPLTLVLFLSNQSPTKMFPLALIVIFFMMIFGTGIALLLSIIYINFDDSKSLIGIVLMSLQYVTPVFYPLSVLGPHTRKVIELNPLTSYLQCFRSVFGGNAHSTSFEWMMMSASALITFILGLYVFQMQWPKVVSKL